MRTRATPHRMFASCAQDRTTGIARISTVNVCKDARNEVLVEKSGVHSTARELHSSYSIRYISIMVRFVVNVSMLGKVRVRRGRTGKGRAQWFCVSRAPRFSVRPAISELLRLFDTLSTQNSSPLLDHYWTSRCHSDTFRAHVFRSASRWCV